MLNAIIKYTVFIATLVALALGWLTYNDDILKPEYDLTIELIKETSLVSEKEDIKGLYTIYNGNRIKSLVKQEYRLTNTGKEEIQSATDVREPVTLDFGEINILSTQINGASSPSLQENSSISKDRYDNKITLTFKDIQPKETLTFFVYFHGNTGLTPNVTARVTKMAEPKFINSPNEEITLKEVFKLFPLLGALLGGLFAASAYSLPRYLLKKKKHT
ncbi:MAG: hypothetical protein QNL04_10410 [SAR324 cluster bacterium]|nr:hypothetical protein [SAR324 cluster bacterium]